MAEVAMTGPTVRDPDWKIRIGKAIFYATAAMGMWFFWWFAGTPCPCL